MTFNFDPKITELSLEIATKAHFGVKRKDGSDYVEHPKRVAKIALNLIEAILNRYYFKYFKIEAISHFVNYVNSLCLLHDQKEDVPEYNELVEATFSASFISSLNLLTKLNGENYFDFINRILKGNIIDWAAIFVKIADLTDNMSDLEEGSKKDKYRFAFYKLNERLEKHLGSGNSVMFYDFISSLFKYKSPSK